MELSVCIPTYNRAAYLRDCLRALVSEVRDRCEVVVIDGGSTDATREIAEEFRHKIPRFKYVHSEENRGVDLDILRAVESATGDYCWLFSDDDCIESGAIDSVLGILASYPNISGVSVHSTAYDSRMRYPVATVPAAGRSCLTQNHFFDSAEEAFRILGIHFGFISCQVIQRRLWLEVATSVDYQPYVGSCWMLVFMIGHMLNRRPSWLYFHRPCVRNRSGNDSFIQRLGIWKRQVIAHVEFFRVLEVFYSRQTATYRAIQDIQIHDRMPRSLATLKANRMDVLLQARLALFYTKRYYDHAGYWLKVFPLFFIPGVVFRLVRKLYFSWQGGLFSQSQES
jgi:O-antigen biosynthesis alpha-1,3-abequosyltransferase